MKNDRGSASVFMMLIFGACLTLSLCLLNGARYILTCREIEGALDAALASVLADCDDDLATRYGIYAYAWQDAAADSAAGRSYFQANLGRHSGFLDMEVRDYSAEPLAEHKMDDDALFDQILQQMKYKGPIEAGEGLLSLFMNVRGLDQIKQAAEAGQSQLDSLGQADETEAAEPLLSQLDALDRKSFADVLMRLPQVIRGRTLSTAARDAGEAVEDPGDALEELKGIFAVKLGMELVDYWDKFKQGVFWVLNNARDQFYMAQYIMDEFTYMTKGSAQDQFFEKTEVEYILCGHAWEIANAGDMAARLLFFRFVLHAAYEFAENYSKSGEILSALAAALVEGYRDASQDVAQLYEGKTIPAIPGQSLVQISYGNHLMLFLMIQDRQTQFERMASLIQANIDHWGQETISGGAAGGTSAGTGSLLTAPGNRPYVTGLSAKASVSVKLWPFEAVIERERVMVYE
jgi:hypothetical protein